MNQCQDAGEEPAKETRNNALDTKKDWTSQPSNLGARFTPNIIPRREASKPRAVPGSQQQERKPKPHAGARKEIEMTASGPFSMGPAKPGAISSAAKGHCAIPRSTRTNESPEDLKVDLKPLGDLKEDLKEDLKSLGDLKSSRDRDAVPRKTAKHLGAPESSDESTDCSSVPEHGLWEPDVLDSSSSTASELSWGDELLLFRIPPGVFQAADGAVCGELKIHKSGKRVMHLGDSKLDLMPIPRKSHYQHAALVCKDTLEYTYLGDVQREYAGILDLGSLLDGS